MTEHVEGDPCKFALWSGRTPSSDNKTVLKVSTAPSGHRSRVGVAEVGGGMRAHLTSKRGPGDSAEPLGLSWERWHHMGIEKQILS